MMGDAVQAIRTVLLLQEDIKQLKDLARVQGDRLSRLADVCSGLDNRISRIEGFLEGAAAAGRAQPRLPE